MGKSTHISTFLTYTLYMLGELFIWPWKNVALLIWPIFFPQFVYLASK